MVVTVEPVFALDPCVEALDLVKRVIPERFSKRVLDEAESVLNVLC